jgi:hypothetical protein
VKLKIIFPSKGWGQGGEMNQALYAHMNNKRKMKKKKKKIFTIKDIILKSSLLVWRHGSNDRVPSWQL